MKYYNGHQISQFPHRSDLDVSDDDKIQITTRSHYDAVKLKCPFLHHGVGDTCYSVMNGY